MRCSWRTILVNAPPSTSSRSSTSRSGVSTARFVVRLSTSFVRPCFHCFDTVGWASGRASNPVHGNSSMHHYECVAPRKDSSLQGPILHQISSLMYPKIQRRQVIECILSNFYTAVPVVVSSSLEEVRRRKSIRPVKIECRGVSVVTCLERSADCLRMI